MHIIGVMPIHGRDELTNLVLEHYSEIGLDIVAAVSPQDEGKHSALLAREVAVPNNPLGTKLNASLAACRDLEPDAVLFLGSDDLVCTGFLRRTNEMMETGIDMMYLRSLYIYGAFERMLIYFPSAFTGVGRCITSELLDKANWKIWSPYKERGMDGDSLTHIKHATGGIYNAQTPGGLAENDIMCVDVKVLSPDGINSFDKLSRRQDWRLVDADEASETLIDRFPSAFKPKMSATLRCSVTANPQSEIASLVAA